MYFSPPTKVSSPSQRFSFYEILTSSIAGANSALVFTLPRLEEIINGFIFFNLMLSASNSNSTSYLIWQKKRNLYFSNYT